MKVKILTPDKTLFSGEAFAVNVPGEAGDVGILEGHAPYAGVLKQGIIEVKIGAKIRQFPVNEGTIEVNDAGDVLILV